MQNETKILAAKENANALWSVGDRLFRRDFLDSSIETWVPLNKKKREALLGKYKIHPLHRIQK